MSLPPTARLTRACLRAEIRELDGERQSLVYNHHHELIDASDTIRKVRRPPPLPCSILLSLRNPPP